MWVRNRGERRASDRQWSARDIDLLRPSTATRAETRHEGSQASEPRRCENVAALDVVRAPKAVRTARASDGIHLANMPRRPKALKMPDRSEAGGVGKGKGSSGRSRWQAVYI